MKLQYIHRGLLFFFVTVAIKGRPQALSQLIESERRLILTAAGDLTLLGSPFLFHVRLTLKKTVAEHEAAIAEIVAKAKRGMIPVSGFISPAVPARDIRRYFGATHQFRQNCLKMNELAAALCAKAGGEEAETTDQFIKG